MDVLVKGMLRRLRMYSARTSDATLPPGAQPQSARIPEIRLSNLPLMALHLSMQRVMSGKSLKASGKISWRRSGSLH